MLLIKYLYRSPWTVIDIVATTIKKPIAFTTLSVLTVAPTFRRAISGVWTPSQTLHPLLVSSFSISWQQLPFLTKASLYICYQLWPNFKSILQYQHLQHDLRDPKVVQRLGHYVFHICRACYENWNKGMMCKSIFKSIFIKWQKIHVYYFNINSYMLSCKYEKLQTKIE